MSTELKDILELLYKFREETLDKWQANDKKLTAIDRTLGCLVERDVRHHIEALQGIDFAKEETFFSLEDLSSRILAAKTGKLLRTNEVQDASLKLASEIESKGIPELYGKHIFELIPKSPCTDAGLEALRNAVTEIGWDGSPDPAMLKALISRLQSHSQTPAIATAHLSGSSTGSSAGSRPSTTTSGVPIDKCHKHLRDTLGSLAQYLEKGSAAAKQQYLLAAGGKGSFGIQMAMYSASIARLDVKQHLEYDDGALQPATTYDKLKLPSTCVQMDVRGSVAVYEKKAAITVGEIKRSDKDYGSAKQQLKERLGLLQWAIKVLYPEVTVFVRVGHIYSIKETATTKHQDCREEDEMAFYVHYL